MHNVYASDNELVLQPCGEDFSFFFDLIKKHWPENSRPFEPLHRVCDLMRKMQADSFLLENLQTFDELDVELNELKRRCGADTIASASRCTFFRRLPEELDWRSLTNNDILGYVVIIKVTCPDSTIRNYVLEAVIRNPERSLQGDIASHLGVPNYYLHCCKDFQTTIGTDSDPDKHRDFSIKGTFFCQQNDLTHVCAHAALRMAVNSCRRYKGDKVTSARINQILGITHKGTSVVGKYGPEKKSKGVKLSKITEVAQVLDFEVRRGHFDNHPMIDYAEFIYPFVESGLPVILEITNAAMGLDGGHVVTILGHTRNSDRWAPPAKVGYRDYPITEYTSAAGWIDHYLASDDNYGMNLALSTESLRSTISPKYNPTLRAADALALIPKGVNVDGYVVEAFAARAIKIKFAAKLSSNRWLETLLCERLVCRTLLQDKRPYIDWLLACKDSDKQSLDPSIRVAIDYALPDSFWVTEITVPHLMTGNKRKLGDIVARAETTEDELKSGEAFVFAWLPGYAWLAPGLKQKYIWPLVGHVNILRGEGGHESVLEW